MDLLNALDGLKDELSLTELSHGLLYLSKLINDPVEFRAIMGYCLQRIGETEKPELADLSRLTLILNTIRGIPIHFTYAILLPRIKECLEREDFTDDDLMNVTITLKPFLR